ncbi:HAMP domain-containing protein [Clostridium bovifaecis]|uniref:histidine kinase n=1 Tax=Clostridium bovifaecis TaxID=2184719 RepID=A0A6I6EYK5_9CLOT|nr:HAMP domain-containing protein [Clostridium bovifaecis]
MRKSIRYKLFIWINGLVVAFVLLFWLLNTQFLENYYISEKKDLLIKSTNTINENYNGEPSDIALALEKLENAAGANIVIVDSKGRPKYSTFLRNIDEIRFEKRISPGEADRKKVPDGKELIKSLGLYDLSFGTDTIFEIQSDIKSKMDFLTMRSVLNEGDIIIIRTPLPAITENVSIANRFIMFTGAIALVMGSVWAYVFSSRFTKPVLELNKLTQNMAKLDFSQSSSIDSEDEIGELSRNINFLSSKLDSTIRKLNDKNQRLVEDIEKERKIDEMRKEFVSNVSHELKTPISLIQGYAEGLRSNVMEEDEESKEFYCNVIINESNRMNRLVKELLNLSQIESGYSELDKEVFNLSSMINSVINNYRAVFKEREIKLSVEESDNIEVYADIVRIEQVIINYINNALNHVDNKKIITLTLKPTEDKVRIFVYNSGKPLPEEALDKIWTSFYKVDKARTRSYGGSGLGLSIVRAIQELHENAYGVENKAEGVVFWFDVDRHLEQ